MNLAGIRAEYFYWASHSRSGCAEDDFRETALRFINTANIGEDDPLFDIEHAFWCSLEELLGGDEWDSPLADARLAALQLMCAYFFSLADSDARYSVPFDLESMMWFEPKKTWYDNDSSCLFLSHFCWNTYDEVTKGAAGADTRLVNLCFASTSYSQKVGLSLAGDKEYSYSGLDLSGTDFTVEALMELPGTLGVNYLVCQGAFEAGTYALAIENGVPIFVIITDGGLVSVNSGGDALEKSTEHEIRVVGEWAENEIRMYVDGSLVDTVAWNDAVSKNEADLFVGSSDGDNYFNGKVFGVRISNTART